MIGDVLILYQTPEISGINKFETKGTEGKQEKYLSPLNLAPSENI